ncbi:hypothetical protein OIU34_22970 [Pararhizobium sp. BT-229]|uniref:hypothetical protein n=1 Tax=Pararhizobium sp. BT-229 TaxID=2986923 RepID=UPI0021F73D2B|nr:hypothetical protein [Pararhizobium sp. BT-229]MCV9964757.1 hypothetical protein [Pararhizobium sp. BT-229]
MDYDLRRHLEAISSRFPRITPWILGEDGRTPVKTDLAGFIEWVEKVGGISIQVGLDDIGDKTVSTVFFDGFSMAGDPNRSPKLFETLICDADGEVHVERRYSTWEEAEQGHAEILSELRPEPATPRGSLP